MTGDSPGVDAWVEHTSAFDRVRSIAGGLAQPRSASYMASEAHVAENTARGHLQRLVKLNVLLEHDESGTTLYAPDPLHTRHQTLRELLTDHDRDGLIELKADMQEQLEAWRDQYDATSPDELRKRAARTETAETTREVRQAASEWDLLEYRLGIVEEAIEKYGTYSQPRGSSTSA